MAGSHAGPLSVERFSGRVAACGLAAHRFRGGLGGLLLLATRVALGGADQATEESDSVSLLGSQVIGFTAVALFGRLADLVRPYLVAKRTRLALSSQIAVYTVERMFDLGAMALIFSSALLLAPDRATLPHHEALQHTALGGLVVAVALAVFAVGVRASGRGRRRSRGKNGWARSHRRWAHR